MARHEFRFAVDGLDLSPDEAALVAERVQDAGLSALAHLGRRPSVGISFGGLDEELQDILRWRGYWIMEARQLAEILPALERAGMPEVG